MKMAALLLGVVLAGPLTLSAAPPKGSMLLSAESFSNSTSDRLISVAKGSASAMIGGFRVTADEITFDQPNKTLICRGVKSISPGFAAPDATDVTISVDVDNVYRLDPTGIVVQPHATVAPSATLFYGHIFDRSHPELPKAAPIAPTFSNTLPKLDLSLSRPQP